MTFESWTQSGAEISLHGAFEAGHEEADAQIAVLQSERNALRKALVELLDKLDAIAETANGIYAFAYVHGMEYRGPNWSLEYEAGRKLLSTPTSKESKCPRCGSHLRHITFPIGANLPYRSCDDAWHVTSGEPARKA